jgi:hypothetical protein
MQLCGADSFREARPNSRSDSPPLVATSNDRYRVQHIRQSILTNVHKILRFEIQGSQVGNRI